MRIEPGSGLEANRAELVLLSLVSLPCQMTLRVAPPCARCRAQELSASLPKPGACHEPAWKASFDPLPNTSSRLSPPERQAKGLPPPSEPGPMGSTKSRGNYSQALGWAMALRRSTSRILPIAQPPPFVSSSCVAPRLPGLCTGTPPSLSPSMPRAAPNSSSTPGQTPSP